MLEYDVATEASKALSQSNAGNLGALQDYAVVWSKSLNKLLAFGGRSNATAFNLNLYAYTPSAGQWQVLETTGSSPGGRAYFCMVPVYGGSKFVLFGGYGPNPTLSDHSDVYVLDFSNPATLVWTMVAADQSPDYRRRSPACAVDHDLFIAWGGGTNGVPVTKNTTMIFNLKTNQWITEFTPVGDVPRPGSKNLAGIIGGSVGGVVCVAAVAWVVYRRRSRQHAQQQDYPMEGPGEESRNSAQNQQLNPKNQSYVELNAMSTLDEPPYKQSSRGPQSLRPGFAWERNTARQNPQNLEHSQRFSA